MARIKTKSEPGSKRPFLLLYINDFLSHETVMLMDNDQFAWYLRMLMNAWKKEPACKLLNDTDSLMIAAGCKDKQAWEDKKGLVLLNWKVCDRGKYLTNQRLQVEYVKMCDVSEKRASAANAKQMQNKCTAIDEQTTATHTQTHTHTKPRSKPSRASQAKPGDVRHEPVKEHIEKCCNHAGVPFVWEAAEGKQLSSFLKGAPKLTVDEVIDLVKLRFRSKDPPGDRPRIWLGNLGRYAKEGNHGKQVNRAQQRQDESLDAIKIAVTRMAGAVNGRDEGGVSEPDDNCGNSASVAGGLGGTGD